MKRLNLPKGCLVNTIGLVCKLEDNGAYTCGRMRGDSFCTKDNPCPDCKKVTYSTKLGRYKKLIWSSLYYWIFKIFVYYFINVKN